MHFTYSSLLQHIGAVHKGTALQDLECNTFMDCTYMVSNKHKCIA